MTKICVKLKDEPFGRIYEKVSSVRDVGGAFCIRYEYKGCNDKEDTIIFDLIDTLEFLGDDE